MLGCKGYGEVLGEVWKSVLGCGEGKERCGRVYGVWQEVKRDVVKRGGRHGKSQHTYSNTSLTPTNFPIPSQHCPHLS